MRVNYQKIYEQLGKLFYAIAAVDGTVKPQEIVKLKELVKKDWLPLEDSIDEFGTDAGNYIYFAFDFLEAMNMSSQEAYQAFADYFRQHEKAFAPPLRKKILTSAKAISKAFHTTSKQESLYLNRLHRLMDRKYAYRTEMNMS